MRKNYLKALAIVAGLLGYSATSIAQYCSFTGTSSSYYINNFSTSGGVTNITNNTSGFTTGGYNDATAMSVGQFEGASVNFSASFGGGTYTYGFNIWVDWNNNQVFDVAEKMYGSGAYVSSANGTITVPLGTAVGTYRMRTLANYLSTNPAACGSASGEAEDYTFTVTTPPSCMPVSALTLAGVSSTTADITWTAGGSEASWNIEYGAPGYTPGTGTQATWPSTAYTITGLTASTNYDVYVQADCGGGDLATWHGPLNATTACAPVVAPWAETFENGGTIPACWNQGTSNAENWKFANTGGSNHIGNNGTITGTTASSGYFAWIDDSTPDNMGTTLESPLIDISALTTPELSFYLISNNEGHSNVNFSISVFDGATWHNNFYTHNTNTSGGWEKIIVNLSSLTFTGNMQLRFVVDEVVSGDFYDDVAIDDVDIHEQPACPEISGLSEITVYADSADITWTAGGSETSWNIQWGTPGFTPGSGTELGAASSPSTTYMVTGLSPNTSYDVYVQANCGSDLSTWIGPLNIITNCTPESVPYLEDFNSGSLSNCWSTTDATNVYVTPSCGTRSNVLRFDYSNNAITNLIDASAVPYSLKVSYYIAESVCGNGADAGETFDVSYWDGTQWIVAKTYDASRPDAYTHEFFIVPVGSYSSDFQVKFQQVTGTTDTWMVDSLVVEQGPSCLPVSGLTLDNLYSDSAQVSWTPLGIETSWNIQWGTPGFTPGTQTEIGAVSYPTTAYMITGLSQDNYYDIYVQANCGSDSSLWYGPLNIFTGYCSVSSTNTSHGIENFTTTNGILNINNTTGPGTYSNYSNMIVANFIGGTDVDFTVTNAGSGTEGIGIWVDWNSNLIFDASEQVYSSGGYVSSGSGTIPIPAGTPNGDYRMRVVANYIASSPTPCDDLGSVNYGEAEDYTFKVVTQPSCMPISNLTVSNFYTDSISITWTAGGIETSWNVEWGAPGFTPGTGTETGAASTPTTTYMVTGLNPSTTYDIYVQANCGSDSSYWALVTGTTLCAPLSLPWSENFDAMTTIGTDIFPNCWISDNSYWFSDNGSYNPSYSAPYSVSIQYGDDDYLWTPEFSLTAGTTYEFSFRWIGDGYTGWSAGAYYSGSQSSIDAVQIDSNFINSSDVTPMTYQKQVICFTPDTSGAYSFGVHVSSNYNPYYLNFDDFSLRAPSANAGTDGATTVCQISGLVDLNNVISINDTNGVWNFSTNPSAIQNDTLFNPASIPFGTTDVYYILNGCIRDSALATINIYPKSNAGTDGTVSTCNYGPLNLFDGLTGNVDLGGQWYNPASQPISGSIVNFNGEIAANYNYIYVVNNGVCPNDTSVIEIQLQDCAGVDEYELKGFVLYPNPSNGIIHIQYSGKGEDVKLDVVDAKGAIVWSKQVQFNDGTTQTIDLSTVENGVYYINMTSKNGGSVMKVIKS